MGFGRIVTLSRVAPLRLAGWTFLLFSLVGCQSNAPGMGDRLVAHAALIDFAGLQPTADIPDLAVSAGIPDDWDPLPTTSNPLFTHRQWRSPSHAVGVGVAHVNLVLPISAKSLIWLAKSQYRKQAEKSGAHLVDQWTDNLGREWFEGENDKYHVRGYAVTSGFDAWIVYTGYRRFGTPHLTEVSLAIRSMESVVPTPMTKQ
jgi:hypothetical protein